MAREIFARSTLHRSPPLGTATPRGLVRPQERDNHGHRRTCPDPPPAHLGADRARGEAAQRAHTAFEGDVRAGADPPLRWCRLVLPAARPLADLPRARL